MSSSHLILCFPHLLLPAIPPSIRVFSNESALRMRWPKYWSFSFSISPSNEYPGLISFMMDWLDLLAAQGTLKSLLQHHSWKASILRCSAFLTVQLSHPYVTTGKTRALSALHKYPVPSLPIGWCVSKRKKLIDNAIELTLLIKNSPATLYTHSDPGFQIYGAPSLQLAVKIKYVN